MFDKVIVKDYYDGPVAGIAVAKDGDVVFFQAVGWDVDHWQRVFAVVKVDRILSDQLLAQLQELEVERRPIWVPGPNTATPATAAAWERVQQCANDADLWSLVESHDLLESTADARLSAVESSRVAGMVRREQIVDLQSQSLLTELLDYLRTSKDQ